MHPYHDLTAANVRHRELSAQAAHRRLVRSVRGSRPPMYFLGRPTRRYREALEGRRAASLRTGRGGDLPAVTPTDMLRRLDAGATVVDVRRADVFAAAHVEGSLNLPLHDRFAETATALLPPGAKVIVVSERGDEREAAGRLAEFGVVDVIGYAVELPSERISRGRARPDERDTQRTHPVAIAAAAS